MKTTLPNLIDTPAYAEAAAKLTELQTDLNKANDRHDAVLSALNADAINPPRRIDAIEAAAYKLLGGKDTSTGQTASALREELATLTETRQVLTAAIGIQRGIVSTLQGIAARACIEVVLPDHKKMVKEIARCLLALDAALTAEHDLTDGLFERNITLGELRPMPLTGLGRLADSNSRAARWLLEAFEYDFINMGEVPDKLKPWAKARKHKPTPAPAPVVADAAGWAA
jgi:hypothetical protein